MKWSDPLRKEIDFVYKSTKIKFPNIKFPCYGGRFYWFLISRHFEYLHFYLTDSSILYTRSGNLITEIPFRNIRMISVRRSVFIKSMFHIRLIADKKHRLFIYRKEHFSTELTGSAIDNINNFLNTLKSGVGDVSGKL